MSNLCCFVRSLLLAHVVQVLWASAAKDGSQSLEEWCSKNSASEYYSVYCTTKDDDGADKYSTDKDGDKNGDTGGGSGGLDKYGDTDKDDDLDKDGDTGGSGGLDKDGDTDKGDDLDKDGDADNDDNLDKDGDTAKDGGSECTASGPPDALSDLPASHSCISQDGVQRCWYLFIPSPRPAQKVPLVLDLHGWGGCAADMARWSGWQEVANSSGAVVMWPQATIPEGSSSTWNAGGDPSEPKVPVDDIGFLRKAIIGVVQSNSGLVDPERVYMAGYSNGCMMAQRFALEASDLVAAVGCQSGNLLYPPATIPSTFQVTPVITVHGNQDICSPSCGHGYTVENIGHWAMLNNCSEAAAAVTAYTDYIEHKYSQCGDAASTVEVVLIELPGVGHASYGSPLDTTQLVWNFVSGYHRGGAASIMSATQPVPLLIAGGSANNQVAQPNSSIAGNLMIQSGDTAATNAVGLGEGEDKGEAEEAVSGAFVVHPRAAHAVVQSIGAFALLFPVLKTW